MFLLIKFLEIICGPVKCHAYFELVYATGAASVLSALHIPQQVAERLDDNI
jgi:hypothetical protein